MMIEFSDRLSVYFDTNVIIYYTEFNVELTERAKVFINSAKRAGARLVTSDLTVAECIYKPYRDRNQTQIDLYRATFESGVFSILPITGDLIIRAAEQGGQLGLKLLDAVHYVTALESGCDVMVTADTRFRSSRYLEVVGI